MFDEADTLTRSARAWSEKARDYYDGNQYTAEELAIFKARHQPPTVNNRIVSIVDTLAGLELKSRTDPKAYPRSLDTTSSLDAEAATDALRYVADNNFFDDMASEIFENFLLEGPAGISVEVEGKGKNREIVLRKMNFSRMFFDPYSLDKQKSDSTYSGLITWMDVDKIPQRWELTDSQKLELKAASSVGSTDSETYDDTPRWFSHGDRARVMVVEMYFEHKYKWHHAIFTKNMFLVKPKISGYKDDKGIPENPHILACPKIARDGSHYGPIKNKLPIQDDINKRHSRSTDLSNRRQTYSKEGAIQDVAKFKRQANDSGGHLEFPAGMGEFGKDYGFVPNEGMSIQEHNMFLAAKNDMDALSKGAVASDNETNLSGKALGRLAGARNLEIMPLVNVHAMWKVRVYRAIWNRIRQFWTKEKWVRVTDEEQNERFVGINRRKTFRDLIMEKNNGEVPQELANHPKLDDPVQAADGSKPLNNKVSEMDVDIFIEDVPDLTSLQEDTFEKMFEMFRVNPEKVPWEAVVKVSPLRAKQKEALLAPQQLSPEQQQAQQEQQAQKQEMIEIEKAGRVEKVRKDASETGKNVAAAQQTGIENAILEAMPIQPTNLSI